MSHLDPLLDDSIEFAKKLRDIGKEVHVDCVEDLPHGFLNFILTSAEAKQASDVCVQRLRDALGMNDVTDQEWEILDNGLQNGELDDLLDDGLLDDGLIDNDLLDDDLVDLGSDDIDGIDFAEDAVAAL